MGLLDVVTSVKKWLNNMKKLLGLKAKWQREDQAL
jgi:hypothetical protein